MRQAGQGPSPWFYRRTRRRSERRLTHRHALLPVCLLVILGAAQVRLERGNDPLGEPEFLPVDEAFVFSARLDDGRLVARWDMPAGYYLYRRAFRIEAEDGTALGELAIPAGKRIEDPYFGASEVYYGQLEIAAPVLRRGAAPLSARFHYQGCAEEGLCYPPQVRRATFAASDEADAANGRDRVVP